MYRIVIVLMLLVTGCMSAPLRMPNGEKIPSGVNTVVLASELNAMDFYVELKQRAVQKDFYFDHTDKDTKSFRTDFYDISDRASMQIKAYVKDVPGGSNAVVNGRFIDFKKLKKKPHLRSKLITYKGKGGKAAKQAWEKLYEFGVGSQKWKADFIKR